MSSKYSTVDGRSKLKCYCASASCDYGRLQIGGVTREVKFLSKVYTNLNTNPHDAFESFCALVFCDFVWNYSCTSHFEIIITIKGTSSNTNISGISLEIQPLRHDAVLLNKLVLINRE